MFCRLGFACASLATLTVLVACTASGPKTVATPDSGAPDATADAPPLSDASADAPMEAAIAYPAPHPAAPQVINAGGPVMTAPKFVIITFKGDSLQAMIDDFAAKVAAAKDYWSGTTAEYGVGPVASVVDIAVEDTPSATLDDSQIHEWLAAKIAGSTPPADAGFAPGDAGEPAFPQPDINTVYMMFYPATVTVTMGGGSSCSSFEGYHDDFALSPGKFVTYSVVGRCPPMGPVMPIDQLTAVASHELIEAATNPLVQDNPAWSSVDSNHLAWDFVGGGEIGDMCAGYPDAFYTPKDLPYLVQKVWSNAAAAASHRSVRAERGEPILQRRPRAHQLDHHQRPDAGHVHDQGNPHPGRQDGRGAARSVQRRADLRSHQGHRLRRRERVPATAARAVVLVRQDERGERRLDPDDHQDVGGRNGGRVRLLESRRRSGRIRPCRTSGWDSSPIERGRDQGRKVDVGATSTATSTSIPSSIPAPTSTSTPTSIPTFLTGSGMAPARSGTSPNGPGIFPGSSGTFPKGRGAFPWRSGTFPEAEGVRPVGSGVFPEHEGTFPVCPGTCPLG